MPGGIHPPLHVIATWPTPNYTNPERRGKEVVILAAILGPLSLSLFGARMWARLRIGRNVGLDDWLMFAAMILVVGLTAFVAFFTEGAGFNTHIWDIEPSRFVKQRKYLIAMESLYAVSHGLIKISILLFYRRLASQSIAWTFRYATWVSIALVLLVTVASALVDFVGCQPFSAFWDQVNPEKIANGYHYTCFDEGVWNTAQGVVSATQDLIAALLPTILYWNLRIPFRQKLGLFIIFGIGYGACAVGALRAYFTWKVYYDTYDELWVLCDISICLLLEVHIGAMCANAPALTVFFKHFFHVERPSYRLQNPSPSGWGGAKKWGFLTSWSSYTETDASRLQPLSRVSSFGSLRQPGPDGVEGSLSNNCPDASILQTKSIKNVEDYRCVPNGDLELGNVRH